MVCLAHLCHTHMLPHHRLGSHRLAICALYQTLLDFDRKYSLAIAIYVFRLLKARIAPTPMCNQFLQ